MHSTATELSDFGADSWQDVNNGFAPAGSRTMPNTTQPLQHMQSDEHQMFGAHHSDWTHSGVVYGQGEARADEGNVEADAAVYALDSDESSDMSERNDSNQLGGQLWESVQLTSVTSFGSSDSTDADFLWLENADENGEASAQQVRTDKNLKGRDSTGQQSRRPFTNQALRDETSSTRKLKACVRCRMQKIRVSRLRFPSCFETKSLKCLIDENDPAGECKTCQSVSKQRLYTLPCVRYKLTECTIFRTGKAPGLEFTFRWPKMKLKDITEWASGDVRTISIMSDVCPVPYEVNVRQFVPIPQDSQKKGWMDGKIKKFKDTTPFAIVNMTSALKDMKNYIDVNVFECVKYFTRHSDPLIDETYTFARRHMEIHQVSALSSALSMLLADGDSPMKRVCSWQTSSACGLPSGVRTPWSIFLARTPWTWTLLWTSRFHWQAKCPSHQ
jgi:hypothetical protein